mgnify:CR=1 FL=1
MRKLKSLLAVAVAATIALPASAITESEQGVTHAHPLTDAQVENYLKNYLGIFQYDGTNWGYTSTQTLSTLQGNNVTVTYSTSSSLPYKTDDGSVTVTKGDYVNKPLYQDTDKQGNPIVINPGEAIFVTLNDYWKGDDWSSFPTLYNQVKYAIKSIEKVEGHSEIASGELFFHSATTNRFFFAVRTNDLFVNRHSHDKGTWKNYSSGSGQSATSIRYLDETATNVRPAPFRWYNEYSVCDPQYTSVSGYFKNHLKASYTKLKDGDFMDVPHSCGNSFGKNHYSTLLDPTPATNEPIAIQAFLYVPSETYPKEIKKGYDYKESIGNLDKAPKMFFYVSDLEVERTASTGNPNCAYAASLEWETSFDKARGQNGIPNFVTWNSTAGGVREESYIYRSIPGKEGYEDWVLVQVNSKDYKITDSNTDKTFVDNTLPAPGDEGYTVYYHVTSKPMKYKANGVRDSVDRKPVQVGETTTLDRDIRIPGTRKFILSLDKNFETAFTAVADNYRQSYNHIKNTVVSEVMPEAPKLADLHTSDVFTLHRTDNGTKTSINTLTITAINGSTVSYTLQDGTTGSVTLTGTDIQALLDKVANRVDQFNLTPGTNYDAIYQLEYNGKIIDESGERVLNLLSNTVESRTYSTDVAVELLYRSGTPDAPQNAEQELYTYDVKFKPIDGNMVSCYDIWLNGKSRIIRVGQNTSGTYTLIGKDASGAFTQDLGFISKQRDGYIHYRADVPLSKKANIAEITDGGTGLVENDAFFTVEVVMVGGNSYGCVDQAKKFQGKHDELAVNVESTVYKMSTNKDKIQQNTLDGNYVAKISWDLNGKEVHIDADQFGQAAQLQYYTVYRKLWNEDNFLPVKNFRIHNPAADLTQRIAEEISGTGGTVVTGDYIWINKLDESGNILKHGYVTTTCVGQEVGQEAEDGALKITPAMIEAFKTSEGADLRNKFVLLDFIKADGFNPATAGMEFPAEYYVTAHFAVPARSQVKGLRLEAVAPSFYKHFFMKNSERARRLTRVPTAIEDVAVDSEVVKTVYYNLQGIEVKEPAAGDIVVARYQHANGQFTSKVIRK